ncbi:LADA_0H03576g1_1 [Lachancea dasiensis]|uniref:Ribokinase n=1 Tax=Lachancea dasiensis TaxID=1072105 RepID=A0A1G4K0B8_9SACH|nr:LADA_0H03576g1_1 [Lachancea dasiensis]
MSEIVVCGSLNYDLVTFTQRLPDAGETITAGKFETHAGGKGLNQTVAIRKLLAQNEHVDVAMIGHVGDDSFGNELKSLLRENDIGVDRVISLEGVNTGVATILVEQESGQNRILLSEGANGHTDFLESDLNRLFPSRERPLDRATNHFVVFQNEIPGTVSIMRWIVANRPHFKVVYNPSPYRELSKEDWSLVDILVINEIEALQVLRSIFSVHDVAAFENMVRKDVLEGYKLVVSRLGTMLNKKQSLGAVIITLGEKGVVFASQDSPDVKYTAACHVPQVIDTTGAGDTFLGGVVSQLCTDHTLEEAIGFAVKASSLSIQKTGAAESIPSFQAVTEVP